MILLIAIISLIGILSGCLWDIYSAAVPEYPAPRIAAFTIGILAWWDIEIIVSIIVIVFMVVWLIIVWISKESEIFSNLHEY